MPTTPEAATKGGSPPRSMQATSCSFAPTVLVDARPVLRVDGVNLVLNM